MAHSPVCSGSRMKKTITAATTPAAGQPTGKPLKEFYDGAFRLAINTQTAVLPMVFPDTVRRWHYSSALGLKPGKNRVVYLEPVPTMGMTMEDLPTLKATVHRQMEEALLKYNN